MEWTTACPDWRERIVGHRSLIPFDPLFPDEAAAALAVFKSLRVVDVAGQPTFGECCEEWVFDFVRAIFGAYDPGEAKRLIREFFLLISKKNFKSTIAAGIMLTALIRNWRHSAELLIVAPTIETAGNSFKPAADMVRADEELLDLLHVQDNFRQITHRITKAVLKVVAADTDTVGGKKAAFVLVEELWVFGKRTNADAMLREATGGLVTRPEGFVIYISTHSDEQPAGVFKTKLDYFRGVRDGTIVDRKSLAVIFEYPEEMVEAEAYFDPSTWYVTNPNIDHGLSREVLEDLMAKARHAGAGELQTHLAKHHNVEIGQKQRANRWAGAEFWERRADKSITLQTLYDRCEVIVAGGDGGGLDDLHGFNALGREREETEVLIVDDGGSARIVRQKRWLSWSHAWCHKGVLERRKSIASRLLDFQKVGELTIVGDDLDDIAQIVEIVREINERGLLACVALDPAGIGEMVDALAAIGVTQDSGQVIGAPQGFAMMNAIKTAERKLANGTLLHNGSSLMAWAVGNVKIEPMATAIRATKQNAGDAKIDPWAALMNSVTEMSKNPEPLGSAIVEILAI